MVSYFSLFFFFKQKTAYEMRISDWSSDVCSSDLSKYTSQLSLDDAAACAEALGVSYETITIEPAVQAFGGMLAPAFNGREPDINEENLQSRGRGVTLKIGRAAWRGRGGQHV